jgi:hypothetical protein
MRLHSLFALWTKTDLPISVYRVVSLDIVGATIGRPRDFVKQNHIAVRR